MNDTHRCALRSPVWLKQTFILISYDFIRLRESAEVSLVFSATGNLKMFKI